jgi:hypothetical protein
MDENQPCNRMMTLLYCNYIQSLNKRTMTQAFTLEYWEDDGWFVGRLRGVPGVFSQGQTLEELKENIRDAYKLMTADE